ncbi:MAG: sigma-70 family RNA polymerase sigma factor [Aestuariibacter sp.]
MFSRKQKSNTSVSTGNEEKRRLYESLVSELHSDIFRYAFWLIKDKAIAEDVVQETYLRAWKSLDSLKDVKAAKAWMITILRRENARRFERKQFDLVDIDEFSIADEEDNHESKLEHRELRKHIAGLNEEYRDPLILQVMLGFSGDEIAELLELNKNTVMTRLFRARNQLKDVLDKAGAIRGLENE